MFCSLVLPDVDILESYLHRIPSETPALLKDLSLSFVIFANVARLGQALSEEDGSKKRVAKEPITRCTWNLSILVPEENSDLGVQPSSHAAVRRYHWWTMAGILHAGISPRQKQER